MVVLHYDYCALVILAIIMFTMIIRHTIRGLSNSFFFHIVVLTALSCVADIFSEWSWISPSVRTVSDYIYFVSNSLIPGFYVLYIYANIGMWFKFRKSPFLITIMIIPEIFELALLAYNIKTGCAFTINSEGFYERGPSEIGLVFWDFVYLFIGVVSIIRYRKIIPFSRRGPLMAMIPFVLAGLIFQQYNPGYETTLFGIAVGILIVSFTVQRSDENLDEVMGVKNYVLAKEEFRKIAVTGQRVCFVLIKIYNQDILRRTRGTRRYNEFLKALSASMLNVVKNHHIDNEVFVLNNNEYGVKLNTDDVEDAKFLCEKLKICFSGFKVGNVLISINSRMCIIRIPDDFTDNGRIESKKIDMEDAVSNFIENFDQKFPGDVNPIILRDFTGEKDFIVKNNIDSILERALENRKFKMYYQPIYSLKEKKFVSAEALIRLEDEEFGFISPSIFIPAAESNGIIYRIGEFVIEDVCHFFAKNNLSELGIHYLEVNLSTAQCIETNLADNIFKITQEYKIKPEQINLEITEGAADINPVIFMNNILKLKKRGFNFSLDDYGTGYSNIERLTNLPLSIVKMDKRFVDGVENPKMRCSIENTVRMFKDPVMNTKIVVEGIEEENVLEIFRNLGCDYIQGYYFSKPLPGDEFIEFLKTHNF